MLELHFRHASTTAHQVALKYVNFGATWRPNQNRQVLKFPICCRYIQGILNGGNRVSVSSLVQAGETGKFTSKLTGGTNICQIWRHLVAKPKTSSP